MRVLFFDYTINGIGFASHGPKENQIVRGRKGQKEIKIKNNNNYERKMKMSDGSLNYSVGTIYLPSGGCDLITFEESGGILYTVHWIAYLI